MSEAQRDGPEIRHNPAQHRYEAWVDGGLAGFLSYRRDPDRVAFLHTEVRDELEGRGIGGALVREALDGARAQGEMVAPLCPFVAAYVKRHPDYRDLIPRDYDRAIGRSDA